MPAVSSALVAGPMPADICHVQRLIPTPCRSSTAPPCALSGGVCTTLEEADQSGVADLVARLDAAGIFQLGEAFASNALVMPDLPCSHLPANDHEPLRIGTMRLGFSIRDIRQLLCSPASLASFEEAVAVCPTKTSRWLQERRTSAPFPAMAEVLCYTDGSFIDCCEGAPAKIGWACAFFVPADADDAAATICVGVLSGAAPPWMRETASELSAYTAECAALAYVLAALQVAAGAGKFDATGTAGTMYGMHLLRRSSSPGRQEYHYVPGHCGHFGNELVDAIAKVALRGVSLGHIVADECCGWLEDGGPLLPWFALACRSLQQGPAWPSVQGQPIHNSHAACDEAPRLLKPFLQIQARTDPEATLPDTAAADSSSLPTLALRIATYNVLSLAAPSKPQMDGPVAEGLAFRTARPALLAQSLRDAGIDIASIQESRCKAGTVHTGCYYRICSGAESGNLGTEVWLRKDKTILHDGKRQARLQPDHIVVHHTSPRRMLLSIDPCGSKLFVLALHGPHRAAEPHVISQWWQETIHLCRTFVGDHDCVIAGDFNASVGSITSECVADHYFEEEDAAGELLHQLLHARRSWIPATFVDLHCGQNWTYVQKRNGREIRPDMIAIPHQWGWGRVTSHVDAGINAGQLAPDHFAAVTSVQLCFQANANLVEASRNLQRRFDEPAMLTEQGRATLSNILHRIPVVPWETSADEHAAQLVEYLQTELTQKFPPDGLRRGRRHSFFTDATWLLHGEVARLRRTCARCRYHVKQHLIAAGGTLCWRFLLTLAASDPTGASSPHT